jgi:hypothetical protein
MRKIVAVKIIGSLRDRVCEKELLILHEEARLILQLFPTAEVVDSG